MNLGTNQVLVTGANGWLGRALVETLINGLNKSSEFGKPDRSLTIKCLVLPGEDTGFLESLSDRVKVFRGSITDINDCNNFTNNAKGALIFHCAGIIHPKRVQHFFDINYQGTKNLLDAATRGQLKRVVYVSSNSPCGTNPNKDHLFDQDAPYNPYMNYGKSKMLAELEIKSSAAKGYVEGVVVRPPWFYGPHQPERQIRFYKMIRDGKVPVVGSGENKRSMAYTANICQGLLLAAIKDNANGQVYWISDERPYTFNEIITTIETVLEREFKIPCAKTRINLPGFFSDIAYLADKSIQGVGFYNQEIHVLSEMNKTIACSILHSTQELGYRPVIDLETGISLCIKEVYNYLTLN